MNPRRGVLSDRLVGVRRAVSQAGLTMRSMGCLYSASCPCGYTADHLLEGIGFLSVPYAPALCHTCKKVFSLRMDRKHVRCPTCRRKPEVIEVDSDEVARCPKCGNTSLQIVNVGIWD